MLIRSEPEERWLPRSDDWSSIYCLLLQQPVRLQSLGSFVCKVQRLFLGIKPDWSTQVCSLDQFALQTKWRHTNEHNGPVCTTDEVTTHKWAHWTSLHYRRSDDTQMSTLHQSAQQTKWRHTNEHIGPVCTTDEVTTHKWAHWSTLHNRRSDDTQVSTLEHSAQQTKWRHTNEHIGPVCTTDEVTTHERRDVIKRVIRIIKFLKYESTALIYMWLLLRLPESFSRPRVKLFLPSICHS